MASPSTSTEPIAIPAGGVARGVVAVPGSKSACHRIFNLALLAGRELLVERPLLAEDTELFLAALATCGFAVERRPAAVRLTPGPSPAAAAIFCGNAGTMFRFLVASLAALPGDWTLDGVERLRQRPVGPLVEALRELGAEIEFLGEAGFPPLRIRGATLAGGRATLDAGESSQYLSALLMAGHGARQPVEIEVRALTSAPYVDLTRRAIAAFGGTVRREGATFRVEPTRLGAARVVVEGDYSAACYPAAAAALTGGEVALRGLDADSAQGDRSFLDLLERMGARVERAADRIVVGGGPGLAALDVDLAAMPDQVPTLAALAPFARGTTRIRNVRHLRLKESDRLAAMATGLRAAGAAVEERPDGLEIPGVWADGKPPSGPVAIDPRRDHRIAMSFAVLGLRRPGVSIEHPEVVAKSYPDFWHDFLRLVQAGHA
ncbi:MAG: 3-phosphoshikimate 1-carboxyvinyltransferase [Acidobacteriota bacterium]